jgi:phosphopantothenoylcysteine decarboxylase/phosphopantothenate--cysteine ligase
MNVIVTAGPTREHIDAVRFITNASSGRMGYAVAEAAVRAGHRVTILAAKACLTSSPPPAGCEIAEFTSVDDLKRILEGRFDVCDALVMTAAVGDFRVENPSTTKLSRKAGPITLRLVPTEDVLASVARRKKAGQIIVAFAVEDPPLKKAQAKALAEMSAKNADYVVLNTPAAMAASSSMAAILSGAGVVLPWGERPKEVLAVEIVRLLG